MRGRRIPFGAAGLTLDADSGTYGVVIWLGTRSEERGKREADYLVPFPGELNDIAASRHREATYRKAWKENGVDRA